MHLARQFTLIDSSVAAAAAVLSVLMTVVAAAGAAGAATAAAAAFVGKEGKLPAHEKLRRIVGVAAEACERNDAMMVDAGEIESISADALDELADFIEKGDSK